MKIFGRTIPAILIACMVAVTAQILSTTTYAADYNVKKFKYKNRGGYNAYLRVYFQNPGGPKYSQRTKAVENSTSGAWIIVSELFGDVKDENGNYVKDENGNNVKETIGDGASVWAEVGIINGETKDCRKSDKVFYYNSSETGNIVTLKTKGTTYNNNRCRITDISE